MELEIQTQHVELDPSWREMVESRIKKLAERFPEIIRVHIVLRGGRHHRQGMQQVDIVVNIPRRTVRAAKEEKNMVTAIHAALVALEREIEKARQLRRRFVKRPGPRPQGSILRVFRDSGFGFILTTGGQEVYFHRNAVHDLAWESLYPGLLVEFELEDGAQGPQASQVSPVGARSHV